MTVTEVVQRLLRYPQDLEVKVENDHTSGFDVKRVYESFNEERDRGTKRVVVISNVEAKVKWKK